MEIAHGAAMSAFEYVFPNDLHVHWTLMIVLYPYITGIVAGAFIVSSLYHVFNVKELKPISHFSLLFAFAFLVCATLPLLNHLGHPERALSMLITPSPTSAMAGFGYIYATYFILLTLEILFIYRPVMIGLKKAAGPLKRTLYTILTFGSDNLSAKALALDHKIIGFLAGLGIPLACVLHGYVGFIFGGVKANPLWATPLMPVIFLLSASVSGIAGIIVAYYVIMAIRKEAINMDCIRMCMKFLWGFFILDFVFEMLEVFSHGYMAAHHWHTLESLLWGPLYTSYWVSQVAIFSVIPFLLMSWLILFRVGDKLFKVVAPVIALMILIQVLLMRWNVVIGGQLMSKSERGSVYYHPEWFEKEGILAAIIIMLLPILILWLIGKFLPFWESSPVTTEEQETAAG